jgi:amino acid adenylation domain-containing protein/thioester reductase-like protein
LVRINEYIVQESGHGKDVSELAGLNLIIHLCNRHSDQTNTAMEVIDTTKNLAALFLQQVNATPNLIALEDGSRTWTYAQLNKEVQSLKTQLKTFGVGRDKLVGVLLGRSAEYIITCLASLCAGGAFLALELAYPSNLLADVIEDAQPAVIVTVRENVGGIPRGAPTILLDAPQENAASAPSLYSEETFPDDDLDRLAFVSYSSGTTGRPKGIANPHRAPVYSYNLRLQLSDLKEGDRVACNVFFIWEILRPLIRGGAVIVVPDKASYDPILLVDLLEKKKVTETLMTPTLLAAILSRNLDLQTSLRQLKSLWFNGEVVSSDLARRAISALPHTRLLNCYSASETHEIACGDVREMLSNDLSVCPVGPPMLPKNTYILDELERAVPDGEIGELYVGGDLLARGYLNLPEVTARSFLPDPFTNKLGARMYRTGDLARVLPTGYLEITGRVGGMLKVRGYSIVPGKVQSVILEKLAVSSCVVTAYGEGLERQVIAYVVLEKASAQGRTVPVIDKYGYSPTARRALKDALAEYMVPTLWIQLEELPTHGVSAKIDLKRLPAPKTIKSPSASPMLLPRRMENTNKDVALICKLWAEVLNVPVEIISDEHSFFDLGGHSLTLANLASKLSTAFKKTISVTSLAENPTVDGHFAVVKDASQKTSSELQQDLLSALREDSILPTEIQPPKSSMCSLDNAKTILITGATGYLGGVLLSDLLKRTTAQIICLVRYNRPSKSVSSAGMARLRNNLLELGLWEDSYSLRVEVIPGNLNHAQFELSTEDFDNLARRVQVIIHAGATVNLVYPYSALRDANVYGTREILRLASISGATVQYVSTNGVLTPTTDGWAEDKFLEINEMPTKISDGYGRTKWVAEQLVLEAGRRGLPVQIFRPGNIGGHSKLGSTNTYDLLNALIVESLIIGSYPNVDSWLIEMTPVDFVSEAIIKLSNDTSAKQQVYHLGDPNPIAASTLFKLFGSLGYSNQPVQWDKWALAWTEKRGSEKKNDAFTADIVRAGMPNAEFLREVIVLKNETSRKCLDLPWPSTDIKLLEVYARHWHCRGWLPQAPQATSRHSAFVIPSNHPTGPLSGKVAIVTGASSGIGAAVALALAKEGAQVAIAARRISALEEVKHRIMSCGKTSKVLLYQTDVTDAKQVASLVQTTEQQLGPVDILVSCAGVMYYTMMANVRTEDWDKTVDVNCKGLLHCISAVLPSMLGREQGHLVAISSDAGRKVFPGLGVYSASKFFVEATLQSLRLETVGTGLRVTSIQPGNTATGLLGMSTDAEAVEKYGQPTGAKVLDTEDVAAAVIYAVKQPKHVAVNEILIEPRDEPI